MTRKDEKRVKQKTMKRRDRPRTRETVPYEKQVKEFTWEIVLDRFENELWRFQGEQSWPTPEDPPSKMWDVADSPPERKSAWLRGYETGTSHAETVIDRLIYRGLLEINKDEITREAFELMHVKAEDIQYDEHLRELSTQQDRENQANRLREIGRRIHKMASAEYRKRHRFPDKIDELKGIVSRLFSEQDTDRIPEKKLARELGLKGVELAALLEYAKDRHVIKEYGRDNGKIVFQRWPQN